MKDGCPVPTGPVYLRPLEMDDLPSIHTWHNDADLYGMLTAPYRGVSRIAAEQWLREKTQFSIHEVAMAICLVEGDRHIGNVYLKQIDWVARHALLAVFIGDLAHRSKGYGTAAIRLMTQHAFGDLGLLRLHLPVLADNTAAAGVYEKCGFRVEGRLRRHAFKEGQFKDVLVMGLCCDDLVAPHPG